MIARCATCPFWEPDPRIMPGARYWRQLTDAEKAEPTWGDCKQAKGRDGQPEIIETLAFASDASDYSATLSTHRTFGCILHPQNKEP